MVVILGNIYDSALMYVCVYQVLCSIMLLPRTHAQGVKQSVCPSVVGTKITISRVLDVCVCYKHNPSVDIGEKLVCTRFECLKKVY